MKVSHSSSPAPSRSGRGPLLGNHLQLSHAVNSSEALRAFLCSGRLAAEADVTLDPRGRPILAHPPLTESDLSLAEFVGQLHRAG